MYRTLKAYSVEMWKSIQQEDVGVDSQPIPLTPGRTPEASAASSHPSSPQKCTVAPQSHPASDIELLEVIEIAQLVFRATLLLKAFGWLHAGVKPIARLISICMITVHTEVCHTRLHIELNLFSCMNAAAACAWVKVSRQQCNHMASMASMHGRTEAK